MSLRCSVITFCPNSRVMILYYMLFQNAKSAFGSACKEKHNSKK